MGSSNNEGGSGNGEGPRTSWVRMPSREERATPAPRPAQPWTPPSQRPPEAQPRVSSSGAPFGGFEAGPTTAMLRRNTDGRRFWAVLAVLVAVLGLGAVAVAMSLRVAPAPASDNTNVTPPPKPEEPKDIVDDDPGAEQEALNHTKDQPAASPKPATGTSTKTSGKSPTTSGARTSKKPGR